MCVSRPGSRILTMASLIKKQILKHLSKWVLPYWLVYTAVLKSVKLSNMVPTKNVCKSYEFRYHWILINWTTSLYFFNRFTKNLSADSINLSTFKGEGELSNLEFDCVAIQNLINLPTWLQINRATCNRVAVKVFSVYLEWEW